MRKRIVCFCFLIIVMIFFLSCKTKASMKLNISEYIELSALSSLELDISYEGVKNPEFVYDVSDPSVLFVEGDVIYTITPGICDITVSMKGHSEAGMISLFVEVVAGEENITLNQGDSYQIECFGNSNVSFKSYDVEIVTVSNSGLVEALNVGNVRVYVRSSIDSNVIKKYNITVLQPKVSEILSKDSLSLNINDEYLLEYQVSPKYSNNEVLFESSNPDVCEVDQNGNLKAKVPGSAIIKIISVENSKVYKEVNICVNGDVASSISVSENFEMNLGETINLNYKVYPDSACQFLKYEIDDNSALVLDDFGNLLAMKSGTFTIKLKTFDGSNLEKNINIKVLEEEMPVFVFDEKFEEHLEINWNDSFDPKLGIYAYDSKDGSLTDDIIIENPVNTKLRDEYHVTYTVTNSDGITVTYDRTVNVVWKYNVNFVGHMGSYYGGSNSEEAILYAASVLNYQAIEIDVKQTKDGVFVLCHDPSFGGYDLESYTWEELKDIEVTETRKSGYAAETVNGNGVYTYKLCTLERYLEICKDYGVKALIELKTSKGISNWTELNDPSSSRMPALMKVIEDAGMLNDVIFLTSQYMCLAWTRENGYEYIPCQYLVASCENQEFLDICIEYDLDISFNVRDNTSNSDEWINKYKEAGCMIATYTFEQYASYTDVQKWIDKGVDYITTDWHDMALLDLSNRK